jgi:predicted DNA-binding transcriptional regulator AlpA
MVHPKEITAYFGISRLTLYRLGKAGFLPDPQKAVSSRRWDRQETIDVLRRVLSKIKNGRHLEQLLEVWRKTNPATARIFYGESLLFL